jgi:hypothetical protein
MGHVGTIGAALVTAVGHRRYATAVHGELHPLSLLLVPRTKVMELTPPRHMPSFELLLIRHDYLMKNSVEFKP